MNDNLYGAACTKALQGGLTLQGRDTYNNSIYKRTLKTGICFRSASGITVAIHGLDPIRTLTVMDCSIHGSMDASSLRVIGFSKKPPKRSPLAARRPPNGRTFIPSATKRIAAGGLPAAKRSSPKNVTVGGDTSDSSSSATETDEFYADLDYFPQSGVSYFFTFSIGGRFDSLSMERNDPMHLDTVGPECCVLLPRGGACICGTTAGTLIQWDTRYRVV